MLLKKLKLKPDSQRIHRHMMLLRSGEQMIAQLAREHLAKLAQKNQLASYPLQLTLAWVSLLSSSLVEHGRGRNNEYLMLEEVMLLVGRYHGRVMTLCVDGRWMSVRVHMDLVTGGTNLMQALPIFSLGVRDIERHTNARAFFELVSRLSNAWDVFWQAQEGLVRNDGFYPAFKHMHEFFPQYKTLLTEYQASLQVRSHANQLEADYDLLAAMGEHYEWRTADPQNRFGLPLEQLVAEYHRVLETIHQKEDRLLAEIYLPFRGRLEVLWKAHREGWRHSARWLGDIRAQNMALQPMIDQLSLFRDCLMLYLEKSGRLRLYRLWENAFQLQTRYAILNHLLERAVSAFCKSGKDRTGALDNKIAEFCVFHALHGRYPELFVPYQDNQPLLLISRAIHEYSVARETAGYNTPGLREFLLLALRQAVDHLPISVGAEFVRLREVAATRSSDLSSCFGLFGSRASARETPAWGGVRFEDRQVTEREPLLTDGESRYTFYSAHD